MTAQWKAATVIYNPSKIDREKIEASVMGAARVNGYDHVYWEATTEDEPGESQARVAVNSGIGLVVACGGDGTIRSVAAGMRGSNAELGIVPHGTGNLLVQNLDIPRQVTAAIDVAFSGVGRPIDLCDAYVVRPDGTEETYPFTVMAGAGLDAQMLVRTDPELKAKIGYLAYCVAALKPLLGGDRMKMTLVSDDHAERVNAHTVIVGNCGELAGKMSLFPDARPDDGIIDVVVMRPKDALGWLHIWSRILAQIVAKAFFTVTRRGRKLTGQGRDLRKLRYFQGRSVSVSFERPEQFEVDGDLVGEVTEFRVTLDPTSLTVRVPSR